MLEHDPTIQDRLREARRSSATRVTTTRLTHRPCVTPRAARRVMLGYIDARVETATVAELIEAITSIDHDLATSDATPKNGATYLLRGVRDLMFTEVQLRVSPDDPTGDELRGLM